MMSEDIELKFQNLSAKISLFADLCDIIEFADQCAKGNDNYEYKMTSALAFITQEVKRISEMCEDIYLKIYCKLFDL